MATDSTGPVPSMLEYRLTAPECDGSGLTVSQPFQFNFGSGMRLPGDSHQKAIMDFWRARTTAVSHLVETDEALFRCINLENATVAEPGAERALVARLWIIVALIDTWSDKRRVPYGIAPRTYCSLGPSMMLLHDGDIEHRSNTVSRFAVLDYKDFEFMIQCHGPELAKRYEQSGGNNDADAPDWTANIKYATFGAYGRNGRYDALDNDRENVVQIAFTKLDPFWLPGPVTSEANIKHANSGITSRKFVGTSRSLADILH